MRAGVVTGRTDFARARGNAAGRERAGAGGRVSASAAGRPGRVRLWLILLGLFSGSVWISERLTREVSADGLTMIDARRSRIDFGARPADERWQAWAAASLARIGEVSALDPAGIESIARAVGALSFVAEVGEPRVLWPDGLEIPVRLRVPAACVRARGEFLAVSADGYLLPGTWPMPPKLEGRYLPVIGPNERAFETIGPGAALRERRHLDALAVAISMRQALSPADFDTLGPVLIDATHARETSVTEPGVVLELGARRLVLFGRPPGSGDPGELPSEFKWRSLAGALDDLRSGDPTRDWSLLDVRWDVPSVQYREEAPAAGLAGVRTENPETGPALSR